MRVILDVNVWISALLWGGVPGKTLRLARNQQITIFASEYLLLELETTLKRDKFKLRLTAILCCFLRIAAFYINTAYCKYSSSY